MPLKFTVSVSNNKSFLLNQDNYFIRTTTITYRARRHNKLLMVHCWLKNS